MWLGFDAQKDNTTALEQAASIFDFREKLTMTKQLLDLLDSLHRDESGQGLVEYILILALVAFGAVLAMKTLAISLSSAFSKVGSMLGSALS